MSTHPTKPKAEPIVGSAAPGILVLDLNGAVQTANGAACALWQARAGELAGDLFPNLFQFEVTSKDADLVQAQWEVLLSAAGEQPITLKLQPKEAAAFDAEVRLEKVGEDPVRYLAVVNRPVAPVLVATPPPADTQHALVNLLNERSPIGFFDLNFVDRQIYYSPAWKGMLGYADGDLPNTYDTWLQLLHPEDTGAAPDRKGRGATVGTRPFSVEFRLRHAAGHYVWVQCAGVQLYGPNGALQRVVGANLDVQDRKEVEESGLRAEERLGHLGDEAGLGIFEIDAVSGQQWFSPAFMALIGAEDAAPTAASEAFLAALPPEEANAGLTAWFLRQQPDHPVFSAALSLKHRDGHVLSVPARIVRVFSRKHELQKIVGWVRIAETSGSDGPDASSQEFASLIHEMHEGVLFADASGRVVLLNPQALRILGCDEKNALGLPAGDVFRLTHRETGQPGIGPVDHVLVAGESLPLNDEFAVESFNGNRYPVTWSCRPVADPAGHVVGAVLVFRNPEEMSLTPEELIRANRFDALGKVAGGIAHDFNNLLTTILGGVSLAKDARDQSGLENSERACLAAKALSKQLLMFSRGGTGVRQTVKTADILHDAIRVAAAGSAVKIETKIPDDLAPISVDRAQMLQVFQNLIINSIQAMPSGSGTIWITSVNYELAENQIPQLAAGTYVAIEVRDNGSGIRPEHLDKIFASFFTTKKTGTGLGLATVRSIVMRHGGAIVVDSELGVGTAFTVFLPPARDEVQEEARRAPVFNYANRTGRVLFMDDDPEICHLTGTMLEGLGYKFDIAKNGEEAVQFYKRYLNIGRPYDVVIMDLTIIGGMGGEQCYKHLRELDPHVRAIIASGYDNDDMARQFYAMGFLGYLTKPYRVGELGRIIKKVLEG